MSTRLPLLLPRVAVRRASVAPPAQPLQFSGELGGARLRLPSGFPLRLRCPSAGERLGLGLARGFSLRFHLTGTGERPCLRLPGGFPLRGERSVLLQVLLL